MQKTDSGESTEKEQPKFIVRTYEQKDREAVIDLCFKHFGKLALPSVQYYMAQHKTEILVLMLMGLFQTTVLNVLINIIVFAIYLYARAYNELRSYMKHDCSDLEAIQIYYLKRQRANFWVAEYDGKVVGCAGLTKGKNHSTADAQLVRLVVDPNMRRMKIGGSLLAAVEEFSIQEGYERMFLNTSSLSTAHIRFVMDRGFVMTSCIPRNMMRGDLMKWRRDIVAYEDKVSVQATNKIRIDENVY